MALVDLFRKLRERGLVDRIPIQDYVSAVSVGMVDGRTILDLDYEEDSRAEVDMNFVMTGHGLFIEVQGTAERAPFGKRTLDAMTALAEKGIAEIIKTQISVLGNLS